MELWCLSFLSLFIGVLALLPCLRPSLKKVHRLFGLSPEQEGLRRADVLFQELEDLLTAGLVPSEQKWKQLRALPDPWGELCDQSFQELRQSGSSVLPTLRRVRALIRAHQSALLDGQAKSSQALAQAGVCGGLVPAFGVGLYLLLPSLQLAWMFWLAFCLAALCLTGLGVAWIVNLALQARWAGLPEERRNWMLSSQCMGERFLALVRTGVPPDLAWSRACEILEGKAVGLTVFWGQSIWGTGEGSGSFRRPVEKAILNAGEGIRKAVQVSLMEGRPCVERVEAVLLGLRKEMASAVDRELCLLPTRSLKPLFCCVAPALMGLLMGALSLTVKGDFFVN